MENTELDNLKFECWNNALHCFGYSYLFKRRYRIYKNIIQTILFVGFGTPLIVGCLVMSFGITQSVITIASLIGIIQLVLSLFAVIYKLEDTILYSHKSSVEHMYLSNKYKSLAQEESMYTSKFKHKYEILEVRRQIISYSDTEQKISDKELRRAHRAGLREFSRKCIKCEEIPYNMESTCCGVCGKFDLRD